MSFEFNKAAFKGGINRFDPPMMLAEDEYFILSNGRIRDGRITPVNDPVEITDVPVGNCQGLYAAGPILLVIIDGKIYYKNFELNNAWTQVGSIPDLDADVDRIYVEVVPSSSMNFSRELTTDDKNSDIRLIDGIAQSNACAVIQDGINQANLLFTNSAPRVSQTYAEWIDDAIHREYMPKGTLMLYQNGILYLVAKDPNDLAGPFIQLQRSVSGRPLDFMVVIKRDGSKEVSEGEGGAHKVAYKVSFNEIISVNAIDNIENGFLVGTGINSYLVIPDFTDLVFGEPTFDSRPVIPTSPVNQFCFVSILGDNAFIDKVGIKSYNSVIVNKNEGNNTPFYKRISGLFGNLQQEICCAANFNDYALFAVNTIHGYGIMVYDNLQAPVDQKEKGFVSFDQWDLGAIKQFANVKYRTINRFFCITASKLYELYSEDAPISTVQFYPGEWSSQKANEEQKATIVNLVFADCEEIGDVEVKLFSDRRLVGTQTRNITEAITITDPEPIPYTPQDERNVKQLTYNFKYSALIGWTCGVNISWSSKLKLLRIRVETEIEAKENSLADKAAILKSIN